MSEQGVTSINSDAVKPDSSVIHSDGNESSQLAASTSSQPLVSTPNNYSQRSNAISNKGTYPMVGGQYNPGFPQSFPQSYLNQAYPQATFSQTGYPQNSPYSPYAQQHYPATTSTQSIPNYYYPSQLSGNYLPQGSYPSVPVNSNYSMSNYGVPINQTQSSNFAQSAPDVTQHQQQSPQTQPSQHSYLSQLNSDTKRNSENKENGQRDDNQNKAATENTTNHDHTHTSHKRERLEDKDGDAEWSPKRTKHSDYQEEKPDDDEEEKDSQEEDEERENEIKEPTEPEEEVEVDVVWPADALIQKEEGDESKEQHYEKVIANGTTFCVGDTIALWPEEGSKAPVPMGIIKSLYTDGENNNVECCWFYTIEETILKGSRRHKVGKREVFLSNHTDENAIESIAKKVTIKSFPEIRDIDAYIKRPDCYYYKKKYNHLDKCFEDL